MAVLAKVLDTGVTLDRALAEAPDLPHPTDRRFARALVATTLRRLGDIDAAIDACLSKKLAKSAVAARHAMRLGVCELRYLDTAPHAAIDQAVALTRAAKLGGFTGLVNAVLRRIVREGEAGEEPPAKIPPVQRNTPDWLWRRWTARFGEAAAARMAEAHAQVPPLDLSLRDPATADHWARELGAELLPTGTLRLANAGPVDALPGFTGGAWWVQDTAAALPVRLLAPAAGARVLDLCAAPGGKTAQLAAMGAAVTALDRDRDRLDLVRQNLARLQLKAEIAQADAASYQPPQPADCILLDAPCSATGTIRRHPDLAWTRRPEDIARQAKVQARLLAHALSLLIPGGTLVYAVCSLEADEGPDIVAAALADNDAIARRPISADELPGLADAITHDGDVQTLPAMWADRGGMDGFFIARLVRK